MNGAKSTYRRGRNLGRKFSCVLAAIAAALATSTAAYADSESTDAQIAVVRPLEFISVENIVFGRVIRGATAGTVLLTPAGVRTATGGVTLVDTDFQPAEFAGMGTNGQFVDISLGANSIFVNGPGAPMRVRNFVIGSTPTAVLSTTPRRFRINSATGIFIFPVGATLEVGANQVPGTYTGNWSITLDYQ
jgi:Domain of unknown function (DUF4402)